MGQALEKKRPVGGWPKHGPENEQDTANPVENGPHDTPETDPKDDA